MRASFSVTRHSTAFQRFVRIRGRVISTVLKTRLLERDTSSTWTGIHQIRQLRTKAGRFAVRAASCLGAERNGSSDQRCVPLNGGEHTPTRNMQCVCLISINTIPRSLGSSRTHRLRISDLMGSSMRNSINGLFQPGKDPSAAVVLSPHVTSYCDVVDRVACVYSVGRISGGS